MPERKVRMAVNGYGVIGKRIADAVAAQDDMELVGVADVVTDWRIRAAQLKGHSVYAASAPAAEAMRTAGIAVAGGLEDLLSRAEVVADATPEVYNQAIVIPETTDAIRALTGIEKDAGASIRKADRALGIRSRFLP